MWERSLLNHAHGWLLFIGILAEWTRPLFGQCLDRSVTPLTVMFVRAHAHTSVCHFSVSESPYIASFRCIASAENQRYNNYFTRSPPPPHQHTTLGAACMLVHVPPVLYYPRGHNICRSCRELLLLYRESEFTFVDPWLSRFMRIGILAEWTRPLFGQCLERSVTPLTVNVRTCTCTQMSVCHLIKHFWITVRSRLHIN